MITRKFSLLGQVMAVGFGALGLFAWPEPAEASTIEVVTTTADRPWVVGAQDERKDGKAQMLSVNLDKVGQTVKGFGTALSELGWQAISLLSEADRRAVLDGLFAPEGGAAFNVIRLPLGASDFSFDFFSYDETKDDFELKDFSLARDEKNLFPLVREAQRRVGADLLIWASPWSPPQWMKNRGHYADKPGANNGLKDENRSFVGEDAFIVEPKYLAAYARYFRKYVDGCRQLGIPVWMVMPQNEYLSTQYWPSCAWRNDTIADFVTRYLGPALEGSGVDIYFGTLDRLYSYEGLDILMNSEVGRRYVKGAGFQWGGLQAMPAAQRRFPQLPLICSEQECHNGANSWKDAGRSWELLRDNFRFGSCLHTYWNVALKTKGASTWKWPQNSLVTVDPARRTYRWNYDYYVLRHASAFVRRGARYVETKGYENAIAFVNPDGSVVVVIANMTDTPKPLSVAIRGQNAHTQLPPGSLRTMIFKR